MVEQTYTCIYCLQTKLRALFNSEHVIPQAFGLYGTQTLTLINKVCNQCNQNLGDTIDSALARGTLEGISRFTHGLKNSKDFSQEKHAKNQTLVAITDPIAGEEIKLIPNSNGVGLQATLKKPIKDVAFKRKDNGKYDEYFWDDIPGKEIVNQKYDVKSRDGILVNEDECARLEKLLGIKLSCYGYRSIPDTIECTTEHKIDKKVFRGIAKIAFNYFAYNNDSSLLLQSCFDPIRNFIVKGIGEKDQFISIIEEPIVPDNNGKAADVHLVTVDAIGHIFSSVSLHNRIHYKIVLAKDYEGKSFGYGHCFDPYEGKIYELGKSSLIVAKTPPRSIQIVKPFIWLPA